MAFLSPRSSMDSDTINTTSLLNNTLLDKPQSIDPASAPPIEDFAYEDDLVDHNCRRQHTWRRLLHAFHLDDTSQRTSSWANTDFSGLNREAKIPRRRIGLRRCWIFGLGVLVVLGLIQLFSLFGGIVAAFFPDDVGRILESWAQIGRKGESLSSWPTDFTRDIIPIRCHSHNDYWRRIPLYSAISAGCISVEADVWLFDEELYVGHSTASLTHNRTLKALYIDPIIDILTKQNPISEFNPRGNASRSGVFDTDPEQALTLLIDFKTAGAATWPYVVSALEPLRSRNYLTHHNGTHIIHGPIIVVGTGNTPFNLVTSDPSNPRHDIFFDAPLDALWEDGEVEDEEDSADHEQKSKDYPSGKTRSVYKTQTRKPSSRTSSSTAKAMDNLARGSRTGSATEGIVPLPNDIYTTANAYYASVSFGAAIGRMWGNRLSPRQMGLIRGQVRGAHRRGLKVRYWELPNWPIGLRNHVWDVLMQEGVDILNVDDLRAAKRWS